MKLREKLFEQNDLKYKEFNKKLNLNSEIIGVRVPILRQFAKEILEKDYLDFLKNYEAFYCEELIIKAIVLAKAKISEEEKIILSKDFIPQINSWAVCDIFCGDLKIKDKELWFKFISPYRHSKEEFKVRFYFVMMLKYFLNESYIDFFIKACKENKNEAYYAKMGIAWALSEACIKFASEIINLFEEKSLDKFIQNKAIQKACESFRVKNEAKESFRNLKIL